MEPMAKLLNRMRESRFTGLGIDLAVNPLACSTRAAFVDRVLAEAVAFQVENLDDSTLEPGEDPVPDGELDDRIDELRAAREVSPLAAFQLAQSLRAFLVLAGYCDEQELPRYVTRPWPHN